MNHQPTFDVARSDGDLYDLRRTGLLSRRGRRGRITLGPGDGTILAVSPRPVASVRVVLPDTARSGEQFSLSIEANAPCGTWVATVREQGTGHVGSGHLIVPPRASARAQLASLSHRDGMLVADLEVSANSADPARTTAIEVSAPTKVRVKPGPRQEVKGSGTARFSLQHELPRRPYRRVVGVRAACGPWVVADEKVEVIFDAVAGRVTRVPVAPGPVKIDGDLRDWGRSCAMQLNDAADVTKQRKPWQGPDDLSATGYLMWDEKHLYFAAEVRDDVLAQPHADGSLLV